MKLGMSQEKLGHALGLTFQQVQGYESNGIKSLAAGGEYSGSARHILFFEDSPGQTKPGGKAPSPNYVSDFLATADGLALTKAFMRIKNAKLRRTIVTLVNEVAGDSTKK